MIKNYLKYIKERSEHLDEIDPYDEDDWENAIINIHDHVTMVDPVDSLMMSEGADIYFTDGSSYLGRIGIVWQIHTFNVCFGVGPTEFIYVSFRSHDGHWFRKDKFKKV